MWLNRFAEAVRMPHSFGRIPSPRFDHGAHQTRVIMAVAESEEGVLIQVGTVKPSSAACGWPCAACGWRSSRFYKVCCVVLRYFRRAILIFFRRRSRQMPHIRCPCRYRIPTTTPNRLGGIRHRRRLPLNQHPRRDRLAFLMEQ